jgi:hypothetical protein
VRAGKKEDNNVLPPERVVEMLASVSGAELELVHSHRYVRTFYMESQPLTLMMNGYVSVRNSLVSFYMHRSC